MGPGDNFRTRVAHILGLPDSSDVDSMARVACCLWISFDPELGAATCSVRSRMKSRAKRS